MMGKVLFLFCSLWLVALCGCKEKTEEVREETAETGSDENYQNWPIFRGDPELQGVSKEDLSGPLEIAWTYEPTVEEGKRRPPIEATPVISEGVVFVGSQDGNFYAVSLEDGGLKWKFDADGPITGPAAVFDGKVFFGDTYGIIYGLNAADGSEVWRKETDGKIEGGVNALQNADGKWQLFIGSHDYFLYCLDAETGEEQWKEETGNYIIATPSIVNSGDTQAVTFGGCDGLLHVIAADGSGKIREVEVGSYIANSSAVRDGICYVAHNGGEVLAVDIDSGEPAWKVDTMEEYTASPAVGEKHLYVASPDKRLVAYDRVHGEEVWAFQGRRSFDSSPLVCPSTIWQAGMDGRLYAINPEDGTEQWSFELGVQVKASPALSRGTLVICGEDGVVYGFRKS